LQYGALFIGSGGETDGCSVQLKGDWSDSYLEKLPSHTPIDLLLIEQNGWSPSTDLSYLKSIPNLRSLAIVARSNINNLPPIPSLQSLAVSYKDYSPIDLSQYPSLSACSLFWSSKISGLFSCTQLRKLTLLKFAFHDLKKLAALKNLETLSIVDCRLSSLSGIESLKSLKILELAYLPKLERLDELTQCPKLEKLKVQKCKRITSLAPLANLQALTYLNFDECANIESLAPLVHCSSLKSVSFTGSTNIIDGDTGILLKNKSIGHLSFVDRKHYTYGKAHWHAERFPGRDWYGFKDIKR
jgi:hypothetical protein